MITKMKLNVANATTYIGIEVPSPEDTNGELLIQLNYLEDLMGWTRIGMNSMNVYQALMSKGYAGHVFFEDHCAYFDTKRDEDVPPIFVDLHAFEYLVSEAADPSLLIPLGTYIYQHKDKLITELREGMTPGNWFIETDPDKPM